MPAMTPSEVKELVKMQLQTGKPIRAPWYRGTGAETPRPAAAAGEGPSKQVGGRGRAVAAGEGPLRQGKGRAVAAG